MHLRLNLHTLKTYCKKNLNEMFIVDKSVKSLYGYGNDLLACKDYESDTIA